jgi:hypothetical protein
MPPTPLKIMPKQLLDFCAQKSIVYSCNSNKCCTMCLETHACRLSISCQNLCLLVASISVPNLPDLCSKLLLAVWPRNPYCTACSNAVAASLICMPVSFLGNRALAAIRLLFLLSLLSLSNSPNSHEE